VLPHPGLGTTYTGDEMRTWDVVILVSCQIKTSAEPESDAESDECDEKLAALEQEIESLGLSVAGIESCEPLEGEEI